MASLAGLSSDHRPCTRCRHIALPILLIGATLMMVPRQSLRRPPLQATAPIGLWPVDGFLRIARGHHRHGSRRHSKILRDQALLGAWARRAGFYGAIYCTSATNDSLKNR